MNYGYGLGLVSGIGPLAALSTTTTTTLARPQQSPTALRLTSCTPATQLSAIRHYVSVALRAPSAMSASMAWRPHPADSSSCGIASTTPQSGLSSAKIPKASPITNISQLLSTSMLAETRRGSSIQAAMLYCTDYATQQFNQAAARAHIGKKKNWSDPNAKASGWFGEAGAKGWTTKLPSKYSSNELPAGTIIVWKGGYYGHVAVVDQVDNDGIHISEANFGRHMDKNGKTDKFSSPPTKTFLTWDKLKQRGRLKLEGYIVPRLR